MKTINRILLISIIYQLISLLQPGKLFAQQNSNTPAVNTQRDGQHDFDFHLGKWKSTITRLVHPLTGSTTWVPMTGTLNARKVWGGRAQIEEFEADDSTHHIEDLLLFLYNPQSHQWSLNAAASNEGTMNTPMTGEFKNGRGEFYDQEPFKGKVILVRQVWSDITPTSHRFEQAFSDDGGKTWEVNFIANLERID
ncbi:hypothetical protein HDF24_18960 [Mucilaginibacter sp. X4EP1]|uniref:hypothetical protein n=1 Tax=Mucilaginibacter sp. X4EP1 TaxID=2723092 RepID=UPI00216A5561|nr:hypothetical protein [Mucilaginibacter sp. X4EP1]MCS3813346.1 hypothetical protein [Mucilaginibacter sp. X4EP1]